MRVMEEKSRPFFIRCWGVLTFAALCLSLFYHGMQKKNATLRELKDKLVVLDKERQEILQEKEGLLAQISSQADPAWVEMTLMRVLGVVPTGYMKVHFERPKEELEP